MLTRTEGLFLAPLALAFSVTYLLPIVIDFLCFQAFRSLIEKLTQDFHVHFFYLLFSFLPCCEMPLACFLPWFNPLPCVLRYQHVVLSWRRWGQSPPGHSVRSHLFRGACSLFVRCILGWFGATSLAGPSFFPQCPSVSVCHSCVHTKHSGSISLVSEFWFILLPSSGLLPAICFLLL